MSSEINQPKEEPAFVRAGGRKSLPQAQGAARRKPRCLVWSRHVGTDRLVRGGADDPWRDARRCGWTGVIRELIPGRSCCWWLGWSSAVRMPGTGCPKQNKAMQDEPEDKHE